MAFNPDATLPDPGMRGWHAEPVAPKTTSCLPPTISTLHRLPHLRPVAGGMPWQPATEAPWTQPLDIFLGGARLLQRGCLEVDLGSCPGSALEVCVGPDRHFSYPGSCALDPAVAPPSHPGAGASNPVVHALGSSCRTPLPRSVLGPPTLPEDLCGFPLGPRWGLTAAPRANCRTHPAQGHHGLSPSNPTSPLMPACPEPSMDQARRTAPHNIP